MISQATGTPGVATRRRSGREVAVFHVAARCEADSELIPTPPPRRQRFGGQAPVSTVCNRRLSPEVHRYRRLQSVDRRRLHRLSSVVWPRLHRFHRLSSVAFHRLHRLSSVASHRLHRLSSVSGPRLHRLSSARRRRYRRLLSVVRPRWTFSRWPVPASFDAGRAWAGSSGRTILALGIRAARGFRAANSSWSMAFRGAMGQGQFAA